MRFAGLRTWWARRSDRRPRTSGSRAAALTVSGAPLVPRVLPSRVTVGLREVAAAWTFRLAPSADLVRRAADLLAETDVDEVFLGLAVLPLDPPSEEVEAALRDAFRASDDEVALSEPNLGPLAVRWVCADALAGGTTPRDLCAAAHGISFWEGPDELHELEQLNDEFDDREYGNALPAPALERRALVAARSFLEFTRGLVAG